eukprot:CAMPEP_0181458826 /NCGR_PEP_ID=MMETSP1110-20121109/32510_1 /TAXON_ID=174948 /ORGANISM="Symbiodinium sp., Strain CCMP421" /LENGTH=387 /DNA_ID=CAMNT_0023583327 /DNA_START=69 /DNA_END=1233 /DNA_ORIENTATION=-
MQPVYAKGRPVWAPVQSSPSSAKEEGHREPHVVHNHQEGHHGERAHPHPGERRLSGASVQDGKASNSLQAWYNHPHDDGNFFIGDHEDDHQRTTVDLSVAVRGLCMEYFEHHVSPLIRSLQSTTGAPAAEAAGASSDDQQDLRETVAVEVARRNEQNAVSTLVRLQEISATLQKKADVNGVPTMAQWKALNAKLERTTVDHDATNNLHELQQRLSAELAKADDRHQALQEKVDALQQELRRPEKRPEEDSQGGLELQKVKALVAAAGANFNKQIKELRQQVKTLKEEAARPTSLADGFEEHRWGRRVSDGASDAGSDHCSDVGSVTAASLAGSVVAGMAPEEKAELRKMQVVVSAAGTAFSTEIKDLKKHLREVQSDLANLKSMAGL